MRVIALLAVLSIATFVSHPAQAQDAAAGEKVFTKCKVCHIADQDRNLIGPSLHGVIGRTAGTHPNFAYSAAMVAAGKSGGQGNQDDISRSQGRSGHNQRHRLPETGFQVSGERSRLLDGCMLIPKDDGQPATSRLRVSRPCRHDGRAQNPNSSRIMMPRPSMRSV